MPIELDLPVPRLRSIAGLKKALVRAAARKQGVPQYIKRAMEDGSTQVLLDAANTWDLSRGCPEYVSDALDRAYDYSDVPGPLFLTENQIRAAVRALERVPDMTEEEQEVMDALDAHLPPGERVLLKTLEALEGGLKHANVDA